MLRTAKKALSFVLVIALLLPMACISNISVSAEANTYKLGDVDRNGRINVRDAALIQRYVAKLAELDADQLYLANVDGRTGVTVRDAAIIQRNVAHMDIPETAKNKDGKKIGDVVTIENGKLVDDIEPTTEASTTVPAELTDGYYLIGPDWTVDSINVSDKFAANPGKEDEYMLETTLTKGDKIKVVEVKEKKIEAWYPSGMDNEYNVDEAHSGNVTIYFKTTEQTDWSDFGGFFYIEATKPSETTKPIEETTKAQEETTVPSDKNTVKFSNNKGWSKVYLYAWDGEGEAKVENAAWPGVELTEKSTNGYGEEQYTATFDKKFTKIIFNDGKEQTVDIDYDATVTGYYPTEKNDKGEWKVDSWTDKPVEETTKAQEETTKAQEETTKAQEETTVPSDKNTVKFSNNKGWSKVYLYAWDGEGEAKVENAAWPGVELTEKSTNGYGEEQYTATFDKKYTKIIFNDGKEQTVDIDYDATVTGYYPTEKNDKGFWKVDSWTDKPVEETTKAQEETTKAQEETTKAQEETTVASEESYTFFFLPQKADFDNGYSFKLNINDDAGTTPEYWHQIDMTKTEDSIEGVSVYKATFKASYEYANEIQFQSWDGENWLDQVVINKKTKLADLDEKLIKSDGSVNDYTVDNGSSEIDDIIVTTPSTDKDYYLVGFINGADVGINGDSNNLGDYKFVNDTVTVTFTQDSYVQIKDSDKTVYGTSDYVGSGTTATFLATGTEKFFVPKGELTFTLTKNADNTFKLDYTAKQASGTTVYLDNASSWSKPYVYYWSDSSTPITWPGVEMKKNSDGKWTYAIPEGMTKCIFSNNGTDQTSNLDVPTDDKNTYDLATNSWK